MSPYYRKRYYLRHPIRWWKLEVARRVRKFVQRGQHGWSVQDVWSFDSYLATVIAEGAEWLRNGHGYPSEMTAEEWDGILKEMAQGFRNYADDQFDWGNREAREAAYDSVQKSLALFSEYFSALWD